MELINGHAYSVRNVEDGQTVSVVGEGEFCIGLTLDERVTCSSLQNLSERSRSSAMAGDDDRIAVPLMMLTVWKTSGVTVSPASRDLKCRLNGEDIEMEAHFIPGGHLEVGDKLFELLEGSANKHPRRHLPPTPGVPLFPVPPPKPQRANVKPAASQCDETGGQGVMREWCLVQLPNSEHELLQQTRDPNQLANLASSYLTRHISVHTDVVMTTELTDSIFKVMQEVAHHRRDILRRFLSEVISEVIDEEKDSQGHTYHVKVTGLLVEILQQFLDPSYLVLLCLQLLRALSHIPGNVATMVVCNTTAAVLGSMAVYRDDERVQNNCLDILARLATFLPAVLVKPPLRESSIDLVTMAVTLHVHKLTIVQAGIRTLANLASSLHLLAFAAMKDVSSLELRAYVALVISVLDYLYNSTLTLVKDALAIFCADLTVKTDGRRFLFEYAKMEQLKSQLKLWSLTGDDAVPTTVTNNWSESEENCEESNDTETDGNGTLGILKKSRSFENLRHPQRRVSFVQEDDLPSSSDSSSPASSPVDSRDSPDIQVLSRSRIYPDGSWDSSDGDCSQVVREQQSDSRCSQLSEAAQSEIDKLADSHQPVSHVQAAASDESSRWGSHPVDVTNFRYSATDIVYMKHLMSLQITCHVCSASVQGSDPPALKLIDMPLSQLLSDPGIPNALWQFASCQFEEDARLMDVDPGMVISVIDAVRYRTLTFELVRKSLQLLLHQLTPKLHVKMFEVTREVLESIVGNPSLADITSDPEFVTSLDQELRNVRQEFTDPHPVTALIDSIRFMVKSRLQLLDHHQN